MMDTTANVNISAGEEPHVDWEMFHLDSEGDNYQAIKETLEEIYNSLKEPPEIDFNNANFGCIFISILARGSISEQPFFLPGEIDNPTYTWHINISTSGQVTIAELKTYQPEKIKNYKLEIIVKATNMNDAIKLLKEEVWDLTTDENEIRLIVEEISEK